MSLRLLAGPSATRLLVTGPGRRCNPQGEAEHQEFRASEPSRPGHEVPQAREADFGSAHLRGPCPPWSPGPSIWGQGSLTQIDLSADREVQGTPKRKAMGHDQLPVPRAGMVLR